MNTKPLRNLLSGISTILLVLIVINPIAPIIPIVGKVLADELPASYPVEEVVIEPVIEEVPSYPTEPLPEELPEILPLAAIGEGAMILGAPTNFSLEESDQSITVRWPEVRYIDTGLEINEPADGYSIYVATTEAGIASATPIILNTCPSTGSNVINTCEYKVTGLINAQKYFVNIKTISGIYESAFGNPAKFATPFNIVLDDNAQFAQEGPLVGYFTSYNDFRPFSTQRGTAANKSDYVYDAVGEDKYDFAYNPAGGFTSNLAIWQTGQFLTGFYDVYVTFQNADGGSNANSAASNVTYRLNDQDPSTTDPIPFGASALEVSLNQRLNEFGVTGSYQGDAGWIKIGTYYYDHALGYVALGGDTSSGYIQIDAVAFQPTEVTHTISGTKYNDVDGNSQIVVEPDYPLSGWGIRLYDEEWNQLDSTTTDSEGNYSFDELSNGTYYVCEVLNTNWYQTIPDSITGTMNLSSTEDEEDYCLEVEISNYSLETIENQDFANAEYASVIVGKFLYNSNFEFIHSDVPFEVFLSEEGVRATENKTIRANGLNSGLAEFAVKAGTYSITEETTPGYKLLGCIALGGTIVPIEGVDTMEEFIASYSHLGLEPGDTGFFLCYNQEDLPLSYTISGTKYNDINGDAIIDESDPALPSWEINLYDEEFGFIESVNTDSNGNYAFDNLEYGTYFVCETNQSGWYQTIPNSTNGVNLDSREDEQSNYCFEVIMDDPLDSEWSDFDFANARYASVIVAKYLYNSAKEYVNNNQGFEVFLTRDGIRATENKTIIPNGQYSGVAEYSIPAGIYSITEIPVDGYDVIGCFGWDESRPIYEGVDTVEEYIEYYQEMDLHPGEVGFFLCFNQEEDLQPTVSITATPNDTAIEQPITMTANYSGGNTPVTVVGWGNGNFAGCSGAANSVVTPSAAGTYTCEVTVEDLDGDTATATKTVVVQPIPVTPTNLVPSIVLFGNAPSTNSSGTVYVSANTNFTIRASLVALGNPTYNYSFGGICAGSFNGSASNFVDSNTLNLAAGNYTCTVSITDSNGDVATASVPVVVSNSQVPSNPNNESNNNNNGGQENNQNSNQGGVLGLESQTCTTKMNVSGFVYLDENQNNQKENSDNGLANVELTIYVLDDENNEVEIVKVTTNAIGYWETKICAGEYRIKINTNNLPANTVVGGAASFAFNVLSEQDKTNINFSIYELNQSGFNWWLLLLLLLIILLAAGGYTAYSARKKD